MHLWSQPVYGLKVSLLRQVQSGERHGSKGLSSVIVWWLCVVSDLSVVCMRKSGRRGLV